MGNTRIVINDPRTAALVHGEQAAITPPAASVGVEENGRIIAGATYEGFNGGNIFMHVRGEKGEAWLLMAGVREAFRYPFVQLGCKRVSGLIAETNQDAQRFAKWLGFQEEGVLLDGAADGDAVLYRMTRKECRFL